jgi:hypothetical protein
MLKFHRLALEITTNWQRAGTFDVKQPRPWLGKHGGKDAHELFPNLEKVIYVPLTAKHNTHRDVPDATAHEGELEFAPRESGEWSFAAKRYVDQVRGALWPDRWESQHLNFELMQSGIVVGEKQDC